MVMSHNKKLQQKNNPLICLVFNPISRDKSTIAKHIRVHMKVEE